MPAGFAQRADRTAGSSAAGCAWEDTGHTTTSGSDRYYCTGTPAAPFNAGTTHADCRSYCASNAAGGSGGSTGTGWPNVLDCRAQVGHDYDLGWSWKPVLDFFDAHRK
jgi:hypothetical protein